MSPVLPTFTLFSGYYILPRRVLLRNSEHASDKPSSAFILWRLHYIRMKIGRVGGSRTLTIAFTERDASSNTPRTRNFANRALNTPTSLLRLCQTGCHTILNCCKLADGEGLEPP